MPGKALGVGVSRLAWVIWLVSSVLAVAAPLLLVRAEAMDSSHARYFSLPAWVTAAALPTAAILILSRRPSNTIGWLLLWAGLLSAISSYAGAFVADAGPFDTAPALALTTSWAAYGWMPSIILVGWIFLLFPDGHFASRRWRLALWNVLLWTGLFTILVALAPERGQGPLTPWVALDVVRGAEGWRGIVGTAVVVMGIVAFASCATSLTVRYRRSSREQQAQLRWLSYASVAWALGLPFDVLVFPQLMPGLSAALFLVGVAVCVSLLRYRLYDIDLVINRTLVYGPLTAILGGMFVATVALSQRVFVAVTGERSDAALVFTTLLVASVSTSIRGRLQSVVDKRFKEPSDPLKELRRLEAQLRSVADVLDISEVTKRFLDEATAAVDAECAKIEVEWDGRRVLAYTCGDWDGQAAVVVPLEWSGRRVGTVSLGARRRMPAYSEKEHETLRRSATTLARTLILARQPFQSATSLGDGAVTGSEVGAVPAFHPHPSPLPSRERG
jgi:hypothetical protein